MIQSIRDLGGSKYPIHYVVPVSLGYLYMVLDSGVISPSSSIIIPFLGVELFTFKTSFHTSILPYLTGLTLLGGTWIDRYNAVIHGLGGPEVNPKTSGVTNASMVGLIFNVAIEDLPKSSQKLEVIAEGVDRARKSSLFFILLAVPAACYLPLLFWSTWVYLVGVPLQGLGLTAGALLFVQLAILARMFLKIFFPAFVPEESVNRIDEPEFHISRDAYLEAQRSDSNRHTSQRID